MGRRAPPISSEAAARRIFEYAPDAQILMILRDPVRRAYSNYRFSVAHGLEDLSFSGAIDAEPERLKGAQFATSVTPYAYRQRGHYIDYVEMYERVFDPSQLHILILRNWSAILVQSRRFIGNLKSTIPLFPSHCIGSSTQPRPGVRNRVTSSEIWHWAIGTASQD